MFYPLGNMLLQFRKQLTLQCEILTSDSTNKAVCSSNLAFIWSSFLGYRLYFITCIVCLHFEVATFNSLCHLGYFQVYLYFEVEVKIILYMLFYWTA